MGSWFNFKGSLHLLRVSSLFLHHSFLNGTKEGLCANFQGQRGPGFFQKTWNSYLIGHLQGCLFRPQNTPSFQDLWSYYTSDPWGCASELQTLQVFTTTQKMKLKDRFKRCWPVDSLFQVPVLFLLQSCLFRKRMVSSNSVWILGG